MSHWWRMEYMNSTHALPCQSTINPPEGYCFVGLHPSTDITADYSILYRKEGNDITISASASKTSDCRKQIASCCSSYSSETTWCVSGNGYLWVSWAHMGPIFYYVSVKICNIMVWVILFMCFLHSRCFATKVFVGCDCRITRRQYHWEVCVKLSYSFHLIMMFCIRATHKAETIYQTTPF